MRDIETIYFDMGNTLLDFHQGRSDDAKDALGLERMASWLQDRGVSVDGGGLREGFFRPWSEVVALRPETLMEYPVEKYIAGCLEPLGVRLGRSECIELMGEFHRGYGEELVIASGAAKTLAELRRRGYRIGVISNCYLYDDVMLGHFRRSGLDEFIDAYSFSYSLGLRKPRPEMFERAIGQLGARPNTSLMVGDSLHADIAGAQVAGMRAAWFNPNGAPNNTPVVPDLTISRLAELLDVF